MTGIVTSAQLILGIYVPFIIALVGLSVPMVAILLSVFAQGREEINRGHLEEFKKLTEDIKANEISKQQGILGLLWKLIRTRVKLLLLDPNYYLLFLLVPPIVSIALSVFGLRDHPEIYFPLSAAFLIFFLAVLWSLIMLIAEITAKRDAKKEERERMSVELLQEILKYSQPNIDLITNCALSIEGKKIKDGDVLPQTVLGKESSWKITFTNSENAHPAKRVEVGIQFPLEKFEIKKQSGYSVYVPDNIVRFEAEYVAKKTALNFTAPIVFTPKITGEYEIQAWLKGENIETVNLTLKVKVEVGA